jgi:hypothetical protein
VGEVEEEVAEETGSRAGPGRVGVFDSVGVGVSDRDEFRPAKSCWANSELVGGKGVCGDGADWGSGE